MNLIFHKVGFVEDYINEPIHKVPEPYQPFNFDRKREEVKRKVRELKATDKEPEED